MPEGAMGAQRPRANLDMLCYKKYIFPFCISPLWLVFFTKMLVILFLFNTKQQNTDNSLWLQHKTFICSPPLTLSTLIIHLACFYNSTKATTNTQGITWSSKKLTQVIPQLVPIRIKPPEIIKPRTLWVLPDVEIQYEA